jgi:hypothetical protein
MPPQKEPQGASKTSTKEQLDWLSKANPMSPFSVANSVGLNLANDHKTGHKIGHQTHLKTHTNQPQ